MRATIGGSCRKRCGSAVARSGRSSKIWCSAAYNIVGVLLAGLGWLPPITAAAGRSLPDVVVMLNPLGSSAIRGRPAVADRSIRWTLDPDPLAEVQTPGQVPRAVIGIHRACRRVRLAVGCP
jgi:hypothetical protein